MSFFSGIASWLGGRRAEKGAAAAREQSDIQFGIGRHDAQVNYGRDMSALLGGNVGHSEFNANNPYFVPNSEHELWSKGLDMIGRERDLEFSGKGMRQAFDIGKQYGLTPQEVAGSPVPGGVSQSGGNNVLGQSGAQAAATRSASMDKAADRKTALQQEAIRSETAVKVASIQAGAQSAGNVLGAVKDIRGQNVQAKTAQAAQTVQERVANIAAEAGKYNARQIASAQIASAKIQQSTALAQLAQKKLVDGAQIQNIAAQTALVLQDKGFKAELHNERWEKLFSSMSAENVMASTIAVLNGVDIKNVLQGVQADEATKAQLRQFIRDATTKDSHFFRELHGITGGIEDTGRAFMDDVRNWWN